VLGTSGEVLGIWTTASHQATVPGPRLLTEPPHQHVSHPQRCPQIKCKQTNCQINQSNEPNSYFKSNKSKIPDLKCHLIYLIRNRVGGTQTAHGGGCILYLP
jgi:hypothetical protein